MAFFCLRQRKYTWKAGKKLLPTLPRNAGQMQHNRQCEHPPPTKKAAHGLPVDPGCHERLLSAFDVVSVRGEAFESSTPAKPRFLPLLHLSQRNSRKLLYVFVNLDFSSLIKLNFMKERKNTALSCGIFAVHLFHQHKLVPVTGLEPVRCRQRWILSPLRLPIPSHRHEFHALLYHIPGQNARADFFV